MHDAEAAFETSETSRALRRAESAVVELEHFIGYGGKHLNTVRYHPTEVRSLRGYPVGTGKNV